MRVWDLSPGYLNRESLLGEHRELHGLHSILLNGKAGYARHPETLRWVGASAGLLARHCQLAAEMTLRGYVDRTPLGCMPADARWPDSFVTEPIDQIALLRRKYRGKAKGRIPLPRSAGELWAQHKYSVMARSPELYQSIGRAVARMTRADRIAGLARELVLVLRERPRPERLANAVDHMWGYVRPFATRDEATRMKSGPASALRLIQALALRERQPYLVASTALSDLSAFVGEGA